MKALQNIEKQVSKLRLDASKAIQDLESQALKVFSTKLEKNKNIFRDL